MTMFFRPTVEDTVGDAVGAGMIGLPLIVVWFILAIRP